MTESLSTFDIVILGALLVSGLLALIRGFVREALAITAFVAAAIAALYALPVFRAPARERIEPGWVADGVVLGVVFLLIYLAVTLITNQLARTLRGGGDVGVLDRTLGFIFGVARGLALAGLGLIAFSAATPPDRMPTWLTEARTYPMIEQTARALQSLAPESSAIATQPLPEEAAAADDPADSVAEPSSEVDSEQGYEQKDRRSLDQLITTTSEASE